MPRRTAFSFEILDIHLQPSIWRAFATTDSVPPSFEMSLLQRLEALKRIFDVEADGEAVTA